MIGSRRGRGGDLRRAEREAKKKKKKKSLAGQVESNNSPAKVPRLASFRGLEPLGGRAAILQDAHMELPHHSGGILCDLLGRGGHPIQFFGWDQYPSLSCPVMNIWLIQGLYGGTVPCLPSRMPFIFEDRAQGHSGSSRR